MADFWYAENFKKIESVQVIVIKFDRKLLRINMMNHNENWHSRPKIFVLGKMPKIEPINIFSPSFRQNFSMIILSNIFEIEHFRIKNGRNMPFFRRNSLLGGAWGLYHRIIQKLLELELLLKICYSGTFWQQTFCKLLLVSIYYSFRNMANFWYAEKF